MKYFLPVLASFFILFGIYSAVHAQNTDNILICHATSSSTNPYNGITIDFNSINLSGHRNHRDDIIPPGTIVITRGNNAFEINYSGKNWDEEGQAIWENGCQLPGTTPDPSATPTPTEEPTITPDPSVTPAPTEEPTITPDPSITPYPSITLTPELSPTPEVSPTPKPEQPSGNICIIKNNISSNANTGGNIINRFTGGLSRIFTGDASINTVISNECGSNYLKLNFPKANIKLIISGNGVGTSNTINYSSTNSIIINQ